MNPRLTQWPILAMAATTLLTCTQAPTTPAADAADTASIEQIDPAAARQLLEARGDDVFVLDVRTPKEQANGVIVGVDGMADWYAWPETFNRLAPQPTTDQPVLVYCHSGRRSNAAADWLAGQGYQVVYNLEGGWSGWTRAGLPVTTIAR